MKSVALKIEEEAVRDPNNETILSELDLMHEVCHFDDTHGTSSNHHMKITGDQLHHYLNHFSHACSSLLKRCRFHDVERNCSEIFIPTITDEGQCCSFNIMPERVMFRNEVTQV